MEEVYYLDIFAKTCKLFQQVKPPNPSCKRRNNVDVSETLKVQPFDSEIPLNLNFHTHFCSNPKAQLAALKHGAMQLLLRQISFSNVERLRKTSLFALSALVRTNSKSQIAFLKIDGLNTLMKLIKEDKSRMLKIKAITLISDLVVEQNDVKRNMIKNGKMTENER